MLVKHQVRLSKGKKCNLRRCLTHFLLPMLLMDKEHCLFEDILETTKLHIQAGKDISNCVFVFCGLPIVMSYVQIVKIAEYTETT